MGLISCTGMGDPGDYEPIELDNPDRSGEQADDQDTSTGKLTGFAEDEILVRFAKGVDTATSLSVHTKMQGQMTRTYRVPSNLHLVQLAPGVDFDDTLRRYQEDPNVLYAEPNYRYQLFDVMPDDPRFAELWALHNDVVDADINAPAAWQVTTGSSDVFIGVLDSGYDYTHEDLAANAFVNPGEVADNGVDDDGNGYIDDIHGINAITDSGDPMDDANHGTHVSGTIAAVGNNGVGVTGVNWDATIVGCKAFDFSGATLDDILQCMDYFLELKTRATDPINIVATNHSWGGGPFSQALYDAIVAHRQAGMLFVAAAGNEFNDNDINPVYPASYDVPNIISVLATDSSDNGANFTNYGSRNVDVGAPGVDILSTTAGNSYEVYSGTSMATPHVTGLVGLLKAQDPSRSPQAIKNLVLTGGEVTAGTEVTTLSGRRIQADMALGCVDQHLLKRYAPATDSVVVATGSPVLLGIISITCDAPAIDPHSVTVAETGEVIELVDTNHMGQFEAEFTPPDIGTYTLTFDTGETITVSAISNYDPAREVDYDYRTITGTPIAVGDDDSAEIASPFPIPFGGAEPGLETIYVGSNGLLSFTGPATSFSNQPLPTAGAETLVAPLWDDLNPAGGGSVAYEVLGTAPERELVIEWRRVPHFPALDAVTFQVVFFEDSPNILFNYEDVTFISDSGEVDASISNGASATVGVQVAPNVARQYSANEAVLSDRMSLLWTMGAPMAVAGPDIVVSPGTEVVLDGTGSVDSDGTIVSYQWTQLAGPPVTLQDADTAVASFTAPDQPATMRFELEVMDDEGKVGTDTVMVIINVAPVAEAGADVLVGTNLVGTLDGTASYDPDGEIVGYRWEQLSGEPVEIMDAEAAVAQFVAPPMAQSLVFELTVTDEHGAQDRDVVVVNVFANEPPMAHAGADRIVRPGAVVALDALDSYDPDGTVERYEWAMESCSTIAGSCTIELDNRETALPSFVAPDVPALIELSLTVTDDAGAVSTDYVTIVVFAQAPTAVIRTPPGCLISGESIVLDASESFDPDGSIVTYEWEQVLGPSVLLEGASSAVVSFVAPPEQTTVAFRLRVTDDDGLTSVTEVSLPIDTPPLAEVTASHTVARAGELVSLDGAMSRGAVSYWWTQVSGAPVELSSRAGVSPTFVAPTPLGSYELMAFELMVSDECGAVSTDQVTIVVVPD